MKVYHNSRLPEYRTPFGASPCGEEITLSVDVWDAPGASCRLRTWVDGQGERFYSMTGSPVDGRTRFTAVIRPEEPCLLWYTFIIDTGYSSVTYGAKQGTVGGEGVLYYGWETSSFQITVYKPRAVPEWYKNGIVYQIFPDRYNRDAKWKQRAEKALKGHANGPRRTLAESWDKPVRYEKNEEGRVVSWEFYGGSLKGIEEKLPHLKELGITVLYLNPIFEAASNHRYDTGDFTKIDPMLGTEKDFRDLCSRAHELGIHIILDGVFNHTGCDSVYFNKYGNYDSVGAFQSEQSPYRSWYRWNEDGTYGCWWGVDDLPDIIEETPSYQSFITEGRDSIVRRWLRAGADGWRLDVADELPDSFIEKIKDAVIEEKGGQGLLLGEVWEDASNKISYSQLRKYLQGSELDSVMNYPLRDAVSRFILGKITAWEVSECVTALRENYPREAFYSALNLMGSHDRARLRTILGGAPEPERLSEEGRALYKLTEEQRGLAKGRLWLMELVQMTFPGVPCVYYGDEAGLEGYTDPYNRSTYPWGHEDGDCRTMLRNCIALRKSFSTLVDGDFEPFSWGEDVFGYHRKKDGEVITVMINRSLSREVEVTIPAFTDTYAELIGNLPIQKKDGSLTLKLRQLGSAVIHFTSPEKAIAAPMEEGTGVLCHVTSLPSAGKRGTIGKSALEFIDMLSDCGQKYWQILPLNPTDSYGSPYAGASAFAGNTDLLGLSEKELRARFSKFTPSREYEDFCRAHEEWLLPYAMFCAVREKYGDDRTRWPGDAVKYSPDLYKNKELASEAAYYRFTQFLFEERWQKVRDHARQKGIRIIGDMPMYVSSFSSDFWASPEMFAVDADGRSALVAGVPPDYFCKDGQLWGNPIYNWDYMKKTGYKWWIRRFRRAFDLYDTVRLDHFRGFESYWAIPAGDKAVNGRWVFGPGMDLFNAVYRELGPLRAIAEDLGFITPAVNALISQTGMMGIDPAQFYDGDVTRGYVPKNKVVYSGTHDNPTLIGWCSEYYPDRDPVETADLILKNIYSSGARVIITPLQDLLRLGDEARMNSPGTTEHNWCWHAREEDRNKAAQRLRELAAYIKRSV